MKRFAALAAILMISAAGANAAPLSPSASADVSKVAGSTVERVACDSIPNNGVRPCFGGGRRWGGRRGGTEVITTAPSGGLDLSTVLLLGAMGGGTGDLTGILPLLALQGAQSNTTVVETRRRRFR